MSKRDRSDSPKQPSRRSSGRNKEKSEHEKDVNGQVSTIAGGFSGGGATSSARKRYVRSGCVLNLNSANALKTGTTLSFSDEDAEEVMPHENDPLVIAIITSGFKIKIVLIDGGSSANVIFWQCFKDLKLSKDLLNPYGGTLVGFSGEHVEVRGVLELRTTFGHGSNAKTVRLTYMVVDAPSPYNVILGRPTLNALGAAVSYPLLCMKYPLEEGGVGKVKGDQELGRKCYAAGLKLKGHCNVLGINGDKFKEIERSNNARVKGSPTGSASTHRGLGSGGKFVAQENEKKNMALKSENPNYRH